MNYPSHGNSTLGQVVNIEISTRDDAPALELTALCQTSLCSNTWNTDSNTVCSVFELLLVFECCSENYHLCQDVKGANTLPCNIQKCRDPNRSETETHIRNLPFIGLLYFLPGFRDEAPDVHGRELQVPPVGTKSWDLQG